MWPFSDSLSQFWIHFWSSEKRVYFLSFGIFWFYVWDIFYIFDHDHIFIHGINALHVIGLAWSTQKTVFTAALFQTICIVMNIACHSRETVHQGHRVHQGHQVHQGHHKVKDRVCVIDITDWPGRVGWLLLGYHVENRNGVGMTQKSL